MMNFMGKNEMKIGLVIMASGLGKRFGGNKLMALLQDKPLIRWIMDTTEDLFEQRIVVTRNRQIMELCADIGMQCIYHEMPYRSDTVRLGVSVLRDDIGYCFFVPGDQPLLKKETLVRLIEAARQNPDRIMRAGNKETIGSPVGFPRSFFEELMNLPDGKGGNWIAKKHLEMIQIILTEDESELLDIDTIEDLALINRKLEERSEQRGCL